MSERLCVAYPLIARFLTSKDLGALILANKSWNTVLRSNLFELYFDGAGCKDESALQSFVDFFRSATMIHLSNVINSHFTGMSRFSVIQMSRSSFILTQRGHIIPFDNLKRLSCGQCCESPLQNESLIHFVNRFTSLLSLQLVEAYFLTDRDFETVMTNCTSLTSLHVSSAFHLFAPASCDLGRNLTSIAIIKCPQCIFFYGKASLSNSTILPVLISLDLSFTALTNTSLSLLLMFFSQHLRSLTLVQCMHLVGNVTIESKNLTELSLRQCAAITALNITCNTLQNLNLALCSRLRSLSLVSSSLPSLCLRMLQSLQQLDLKCDNLKILDLSGCSLLFQESGNSLFDFGQVMSLQCDALVQEGYSPYLARQIEILQQNNPELDISKVVAHYSGGTVLFEQRKVLLAVLAQIKFPKSIAHSNYRNNNRLQTAYAKGIRKATNRTKSL